MRLTSHKSGRWGIAFTLAACVLLSNLPLALAAPGDTNSTNIGRDIQGGTYYNTPGNKTTFTNPSGDLILGSGTKVRGLEVDSNGNLTGNGGTMLFSAPKGMFRLDGTVDVSSVLNDSGIPIGNGGTVLIEAAALYQNGSIFANGINGGVVHVNVVSMTMGPNARIDATGFGGGNGGVVDIKASKDINIAQGAIIDTSGKVIGNYNTNVIRIEGGLVNLDGVIRANGLVAGEQGGSVTLVALSGNVNIGANGAVTANGAAGGNGGSVAVKANKGSIGNNGTISTNGGDSFHTDDANVNADAGHGGIVLVSATQGNINNAGIISANGGNGFVGWNAVTTNGGNGGHVSILAPKNQVNNSGTISVDGGHGGYNPDTAVGPVIPAPYGGTAQTSLGQDGGRGGDAGSIVLAFNTNKISNTGIISARGGNGGNGQDALANDPAADNHYAVGGNGGNGGNGGFVEFYGQPSQAVLDNTKVDGGSGGQGGAAEPKDCECSGSGGACGSPGKIVVHPPDTPPPPPPPPPDAPPPPPYVRDNLRVGDSLPAGVGSVISYNRSIFMARAPLPIIQRKPAPPPPPAPEPTPAPENPKPKPVPPKKRVPVRGYW